MSLNRFRTALLNKLPVRRNREQGFTLAEVMVAMVIGLIVTTGTAATALAQAKITDNNLRISVQQSVEAADITLRTHLLDYRQNGTTLLWPDAVPLQLPAGSTTISIGAVTSFDAEGFPIFDDTIRPTWDNYSIQGKTPGGWAYIYDRETSKYYKVPTAVSND